MTNLQFKYLKNNAHSVISSKSFFISALLLILGYGCMAAWLTTGPIILEDTLSLSAIEFGWCAAAVGLCFFIGAFINSKFSAKIPIYKLFYCGSGCIFVSAISLLVSYLVFHYLSTFVFVMSVAIAAFGISMLIPNAYAYGLSGLSKVAGISVVGKDLVLPYHYYLEDGRIH